MQPIKIITVPEGAAGRMDAWLAEYLTGFSRTRIKKMIENGHIRMKDRLATPRCSVCPGMQIIVHEPEPQDSELTPENIPLDILYEDDDLIVLNKPAGLVVHPAAGHSNGTLVNALLHHCPHLPTLGGERRPGIVHRLDKDTSGVMIVAKGETAMLSLTRQFHDGLIHKEYIAIILGRPHPLQADIKTGIARHPHHRKKMTAVKERGRKAHSFYQVEKVFDGFSLVRIRLYSGRTHQIRVHMAHIGHPVLGDALYGSRQKEKRQGIDFCAGRQLLHAETIAFNHPRDNRRMTFSAPWPEDIKKLTEID